MANKLPWLDQHDVELNLPYDKLIEALRNGFTSNFSAPLRHHHYWGKRNDELLMMPTWDDENLTVKLVTLCPNNTTTSFDTNNGVVVLFDSNTGCPIAMMDAGELTARRTAAASALASSYLARKDASSFLLIGTGRLSKYMVEAHLSVRNYKEIKVWGRSEEKVQKTIAELLPIIPEGTSVEKAASLENAVRHSDVISAATRSEYPIVRGHWLSPGSHIDLVGGYKPNMREIDSEGVGKSKIFADTYEGVLAEAGDIIVPINEGLITKSDLKAELRDLCRNKHIGRETETEITLFKSVGTALEDLVASKLTLNLYRSQQGLE